MLLANAKIAPRPNYGKDRTKRLVRWLIFSLFALSAAVSATPPLMPSTTSSLVPVRGAAAAWGDYDNDGNLDLVLTGYAPPAAVTRLYHGDGQGNLLDSNLKLTGVRSGYVEWIDYDNDGLLDLFVSGLTTDSSTTRVFHNIGGGKFDTTAITFGSMYGTAKWGDFNNDGLPDLFLSAPSAAPKLFLQQRDHTFRATTLPLNFACSYTAVGDVDGDGMLDLVISRGDATPLGTFWLRNKGDGFVSIPVLTEKTGGPVTLANFDNNNQLDVFANRYGLEARIFPDSNFTNALVLSVDWTGGMAPADFDNDGRMDFLLQHYPNSPYSVALYQNQGSFTFSKVMDFPLLADTAAWGDLDNDGDLDLVIAGDPDIQSQLYLNQASKPNLPPSAPSGLLVELEASKVVFRWNPATDAEQPAGLSYNVRVGTTPGGIDVLSPMTLPSGKRLLPAMGNAGLRHFLWLTNLTVGQRYYWSVQAIDNSFAGSSFGAEQTFVAGSGPAITPIPDQTTKEDQPFSVSFSVSNGGPGPIQAAAVSDHPELFSAFNIVGISQSEFRLDAQPAPNAFGTATITLNATTSTGKASQHFVLQIQAINDAPEAVSQELTAIKNTTRPVQLFGNDVDHDQLTYAITTPPAHGTLSGTAPALIYTPEQGFIGTDSFVFKVQDAVLSSGPALVTLKVQEPSPAPVKVWELPLTLAGIPPALLNSGDVVIADATGVKAVRPDGTMRWNFEMGRSPGGAPVVGPAGEIYFGTGNDVLALNPDGTLKWKFTPPPRLGPQFGNFGSVVLGTDGAIYCAVPLGGLLFALNSDGAYRWSIAADLVAPPVIGPNGMMWLLGSARMSAINADGGVRWKKLDAYGRPDAPALSGDGRLYSGYSAALTATALDGQTVWAYSSSSSPVSSPVVGVDGTAYQPLYSGLLLALSPGGSKKWETRVSTAPLESGNATPVLLLDGTLLLSAAGTLVSVDGTGGGVRWRFPTGFDRALAPLAGPEGRIYLIAGSSDGTAKLLALQSSEAALAANAPWPMLLRDTRNSASLAVLSIPGKATNLTASVNSFPDRVALAWDSVQGAVRYDVFRGQDVSGSDAELIATGVTGGNTFDDHSGTSGVDYFYFVLARNAAGQGPLSEGTLGRRRAARIGEPEWTFAAEGRIDNPPAIAPDGSVFFGTTAGLLYGLDAFGLQRWKFDFGGEIANAPAIAPAGSIYFTGGTFGGTLQHHEAYFALYAFDGKGNLKWELPILGETLSPVALGNDGNIYLSNTGGPRDDWKPEFLAVRPDGTVRWRFADGHSFSRAPVIGYDGTIYALSNDKWLHAFSPEGELLWEVARTEVSDLILDGDGVILTAYTTSGATNPDAQPAAKYAALQGVPLAVDPAGNLYTAFDQIRVWDSSGAQIRSVAGLVPRGIAIGQNGSFYADRDQTLAAVTSTGQVAWEFATPGGRITTPVMGAAELVLIGGDNGVLYAVRTASGVANSIWPASRNDPGQTGRASEAPRVPAAPVNVKATARVTDNRITWDSVSGASSYQVLRALSAAGDFTPLAEVTATIHYDDYSAIPGQIYFYSLRARNSSGVSPSGSIASAARLQTVPGDLLYEWNVIGGLAGPPAIAPNGTIYVGCGQFNNNGQIVPPALLALGPRGSILWRTPMDGLRVHSPLLMSDGTLVAGIALTDNPAGPSVLAAFQPDGTIKWQFPTFGVVASPPAETSDSSIVAADQYGAIYGMDLNGNPLWHLETGHPFVASPAIAGDGVILCNSADGTLFALSPQGTILWSVLLGGADNRSLALDANGTAYVAARRFGIAAINTDGTLRWNTSSNVNFGSPLLSETNVFALRTDGTYAFDLQATKQWTNVSPNILVETLGLAENRIFAANSAGTLFAIDESGKNLWSRQLSGYLSAPAMAPDGTIYVGGSDGIVHSIASSAPVRGAWPLFQHDSRHTGRADPRLRLPAAPAGVSASSNLFNNRIEVAWESVAGARSYDIWRGLDAEPVNALKVGSISGTNRFTDLQVDAGKPYWYFVRSWNPAGESASSSSAIGARRVALAGEIVADVTLPSTTLRGFAASPDNSFYVGTDAGLFAFAPNLTQKWRYGPPRYSYGEPVFDPHGLIYSANGNRFLIALDFQGAETWTTAGFQTTSSLPPALSGDGTLYVVDRVPNFDALDGNGTVEWTLPAQGTPGWALAIAPDGVVYANLSDNVLSAIGADHTIQWDFTFPGRVYSYAALGADGTIYVSALDDSLGGAFLYAIDRKGARKWRYRTFTSLRGSDPIVGPDGTVYIAVQGGRLAALAPDGTEKWRFAAQDPITGVALSEDGNAFVLAGALHVYAIDGFGKQIFHTSAGSNAAGAPLLLPDGRLIVGKRDGFLMIQTGGGIPAGYPWPTLHQNNARTSYLPLIVESSVGTVLSFHYGEAVAIQPLIKAGSRKIVEARLLSSSNVIARINEPPFQFPASVLPSGVSKLLLQVVDEQGSTYGVGSISVTNQPLILGASATKTTLTLSTKPLSGHEYALETSTDLVTWSTVVDGKLTNNATLYWAIDLSKAPQSAAFRLKSTKGQ